MLNVSFIAQAATLISDPARANMLYALKDDGDIASGDLAAVAGVAPSTASEHLAKLVEAGLIRVHPKGRHRYYSLSGPIVAEILEGLEGIAATLSDRTMKPIRHDPAILRARCCYDHIAGRLGVQLADAMLASKFIANTSSGPDLTTDGTSWLSSIGVDAGMLRAEPRKFLRFCPDWSENSIHIGGALGAALFHNLVNLGWLRRVRGAKALKITPAGAAGFRSRFNLDINAPDAR